MSKLPRVQDPLKPFTLPLSNQKISYRAFKVREEKILLMAAESGEEKDLITAFKQVINNCIVEDIDPGKIPLFDLECLFVLLRTASVNEVAKFVIKEASGGTSEVTFDIKQALDNVIGELIIPDKKIQLTPEIGVIMGNLTLDVFIDSLYQELLTETEVVMNTLASLIDKIYDNDNVYSVADYEKSEILDFIDDMPTEALEKLKDYIQQIPRLMLEVPYMDSKGQPQVLKLEGLSDFFQYV